MQLQNSVWFGRTRLYLFLYTNIILTKMIHLLFSPVLDPRSFFCMLNLANIIYFPLSFEWFVTHIDGTGERDFEGCWLSLSFSLFDTSDSHGYVRYPIRSYTSMMMSSNGNILCITGHLCGEFTGSRWIPHTKAIDAELWCFLWSASE